MKVREIIKLNSEHYHYEESARAAGYRLVAGGDEAGRGPWAGPVYAAFVILNGEKRIEGLDDSKKLSRKRRRELFEQIKTDALAFGIGTASPEEIDRINILEATRLAFQRAFTGLPQSPDYVLLDFIKLPWLSLPHQAFARGESISASVAAASILAKEARDRYMEEVAQMYPQYGFDKHMGYGTAAHQQALLAHGPCSLHRRSFRPIKKLLPDENLFTATCR
ncbi:MAG: ribonuclease HII [Candidatus Riflebacteria bacterium HGW-Riflebacteria-2]|jgi:ribonuclease HII|nr:MAG: ribonuclease HII [Candidatus Riflebacteria bacterium HGW-Riflebacteria-2]